MSEISGLKDVNVLCDNGCFQIFVKPFANLPMKKILIASIFLSFSSLVFAAGHDVMASPGDPKKEKQPQPSFSLSKGYFSLFNIIPYTKPQPDTAKVIPAPVPSTPQSQPAKK